MRLIDGDQLEQRLLDEAARIMADDLYGKDRQRMARGLQKAAEICRATETVIDPVKHGRWIRWVQNKDEWPAAMCSECQDKVEADNEGKYPNYCPNCGARMDQEADDEID